MSHDHGRGSAECRAMFAQLSEYLDGELPPDLCDEMDEHMDDCPPCQAFLESLRRTVRLAADQGRTGLPDDVRQAAREAWERLRRST
jgi:anti-sigma factor RsiW